MLEEFTDENEPWLLIGIPNRDPFFLTHYLERRSVSLDQHVKELMSLREGLHVMMQCDMRQHFADRYWLHVRITVFCSAIVIDVIVHCHTAGALLSQSAENNCPIIVWLGFDPFRPVHDHIGSGAGNPAIVTFALDRDVGHRVYSIAVTVLLRPPTVATGACVLLWRLHHCFFSAMRRTMRRRDWE